MSSKSNNRATLRAHAARLELIANQGDGDDLDIAAATRAITETLSELYGGRVEDVTVEEAADEIVIRFSTVDSSFEDAEPAEEAVANAAPDYETWLRANSDKLEPEPAIDENAAPDYGEWIAARGGK